MERDIMPNDLVIISSEGYTPTTLRITYITPDIIYLVDPNNPTITGALVNINNKW